MVWKYLLTTVVMFGIGSWGNNSYLRKEAHRMLSDCCNNLTCVLNYNKAERQLSQTMVICRIPSDSDSDEVILNDDEIKKFYSHMEWSNIADVLQFMLHTLTHLHQKHRDNLNDINNIFVASVVDPFYMSIRNFNELLKYISQTIQDKSKFSSTSDMMPLTNLTECGRTFEKNIAAVVNSCKNLAIRMEKLYQERIEHYNFLRKFLLKCENEIAETSKILARKQKQAEKAALLQESVESLVEEALRHEEEKVYQEKFYCRFFEFIEKTLSFFETKKCYRMNLYLFNDEKKKNIHVLKTKMQNQEHAMSYVIKNKNRKEQELLDTLKMVAILEHELDRTDKHVASTTQTIEQLQTAINHIDEIYAQIKKEETEIDAGNLSVSKKWLSLNLSLIAEQLRQFQDEIYKIKGWKQVSFHLNFSTQQISEMENMAKEI